MAHNKFATMVHKNTNKFTLVLVYVALEWALIAMLLLNALFSYLILRFSEVFGLQTPCIFCSRIDHVFGQKKKKGFWVDLLCKAHVSEVSQSGFGSSDKELGGLAEFCENCSETHIEREENEMVKNMGDLQNTRKENLITKVDPIEENDEFEEIKSGCSVLEINSGVREKEPAEGVELNFGTVLKDQTRFDNRIENTIEESDYQNCDKFPVLESSEMKANDYNSIIFQTKNCEFVCEQMHSDSITGEGYEMALNESEEDVSIGTEIPDIESTDEIYHHETYIKEDDHGFKQVEEDVVGLKTISVDAMDRQITFGLELNNTVEEKIPDTPSSIESLHHLYKSLQLLDKKDLGAEESINGSVVSEFEGDGVMSNEQLISVLRAERKALNELYTELEEERSASAIAANQTMAMINRLQEEKAAMQMEALHYQRMMEEQSLYDQEALELLNELLGKREKEKRELEKELDAYRHKVLEQEGKGNLKIMMEEGQNGSFSSSSNGDSDGLSVDFSREDRGEDSYDEDEGDQTTPVEAILRLDESSDKFEKERLLILQQLQLLEEKYFTIADDDEEEKEQNFEVIKSTNHIYEINGNHTEKQNGIETEFTKETNGKHHFGRRIMGMKGKKLLPLFHAAENGHMVDNGHLNGFDSDRLEISVNKSIQLENRNLDTEEEFERLYERLQVLETDKEVLKHCNRSLRKGDNAIELLQEI